MLGVVRGRLHRLRGKLPYGLLWQLHGHLPRVLVLLVMLRLLRLRGMRRVRLALLWGMLRLRGLLRLFGKMLRVMLRLLQLLFGQLQPGVQNLLLWLFRLFGVMLGELLLDLRRRMLFGVFRQLHRMPGGLLRRMPVGLFGRLQLIMFVGMHGHLHRFMHGYLLGAGFRPCHEMKG